MFAAMYVTMKIYVPLLYSSPYACPQSLSNDKAVAIYCF